MGSEVEREIERGNEAAWPDRHAFPHAHIALGARRDIERLHFAIVADGFFSGDPEGIDQPSDFAFRILLR